MKKWKKLTVALAGIAACVGLIGSPAMVQAKEDSAKAVLQTQTVSESDQTEAELSAVKAVKLNADKVGETTSYNDMMYSPEKNGIYFVHTVGEVYGNYRSKFEKLHISGCSCRRRKRAAGNAGRKRIRRS